MRAFGLVQLLLLVAAASAGCSEGPDDAEAAAAPPGGDATGTGGVADPEAGSAEGAEPMAPLHEGLPVAWSGTLEAGVRACDAGTIGCETVRPGEEDQERVVEAGEGTIAGGWVNLTWEPASALTEELRLVVRTEVPDCEDCESATLALVVGPSPLAASWPAMERPLFEGEVVRVYVRADHAQYHEPYYVQADFTQAFEVEGLVVVERPPAATVGA